MDLEQRRNEKGGEGRRASTTEAHQRYKKKPFFLLYLWLTARTVDLMHVSQLRSGVCVRVSDSRRLNVYAVCLSPCAQTHVPDCAFSVAPLGSGCS